MSIMSISNPNHSLLQALEMTEKMLEFVKAENWDEVAEIEAVRKKILFDNLQTGVSIDPSSDLGVDIQKILKIDKEIQELVSQARNSVRDELIEMSRSKNQVSAYQQP